jgi:hypothetical protein
MSSDVKPSPGMPVKTRRRSARKLDDQKVLALARAGVPAVDIAKHQGVQRTTVWRFLQQHKESISRVEIFKANRADLLADLQGDAMDLQKRIIATFDDGMLSALKPGEKTGLLMALNATHGTTFDKERLERGQSTQNVSLIGKMMGSALDSAHKVPEPTPNEAPKLGS